MADNTFTISIDKTYQGFSPMAFENSLTEFGNGGHASAMTNCDVLSADFFTQGPGFVDLTNGTQAGAVTELITFIYDKSVATKAYGIGQTKLFELTNTAVTNAGDFPHAITNSTDGESIVVLKGVLYYFFNKSSGGEIGSFDLSSTFDDDWGSTIPTGAASLQKALHPSDGKEDVMIFGNGRYAGVYIGGTNTVAPTKLDFGNDAEVSDVIFSGNQWLIAVNKGSTGRTEGQIYTYEASGLSSILDDETAVGMQKIGFLYRLNGIVYVAYQDLSSTGFKIGYLSGRRIINLGSYTGALPGFAQKTLFKNTIIYLSSNDIWSSGSLAEELPVQISQLAGTEFIATGALAAPFGTPMMASAEESSFKLSKFSGYNTNSNWKSIVFPTTQGRFKGYIDEITVLTNTLGANARADLTIEYNQAVGTTTLKQITGTGDRKFVFDNFDVGSVSDFRIAIDYSNGDTTNPVQIRNILVKGHWTL